MGDEACPGGGHRAGHALRPAHRHRAPGPLRPDRPGGIARALHPPGAGRGEFKTRGDFFAHNRALVEEVEDLEDRARKRDILVDEETLFAFYDERLPAEIVNGKGFEAWRKKAEAEDPGILKFDRAALLAREAGEVTQADYPDELTLNGVRYPLAYHFEPGAQDDGVTLTVPAAMLPQLPLARLEWLVPGLLREKCIALMKSLPKAIRRQVVPIPDWVDAALEAMTPDDIPLTEALGEFLRRKTGVRLHPDDWNLEALEPHLVMNLRVVDHQGETLGQGATPASWSAASRRPRGRAPGPWPSRRATRANLPPCPRRRCPSPGSPPRPVSGWRPIPPWCPPRRPSGSSSSIIPTRPARRIATAWCGRPWSSGPTRLAPSSGSRGLPPVRCCSPRWAASER